MDYKVNGSTRSSSFADGRRVVAAVDWLPVLAVTLSAWLVSVVGASTSWRAADTANSSSSDEETLLRYPFFITEPPQSVFARNAGDVLLRCTAGPPGVEVTWRNNDRTIHSGHKGISVVDGGTSLHIRSFSRDQHAGTYHCVGNNSLGSVLSNPIKLVESELHGFQSDSSSANSLSIIEDNVVCIPCPQPISSPAALVQVWMNGSKLEMTARHRLLDSGGLLIVGVRKESDQGLYNCVATNPISQQRIFARSYTRLIVNQAPALNVTARLLGTLPKSVRVARGDTLTLACSADGSPVPSVRWSRYGGHLPADRYSQSFGVLTIRQVDLLDEGTYICEASNDNIRSQRKAVSVSVQVPPKIVSPLKSQTALVGATVTLTCAMEGVPRPAVTWLHNSFPVVGESSTTEDLQDNLIDSKLTLVGVDRRDSGVYQCVVNNSLGTTYSSAALTVANSVQNFAPHVSDSSHSTRRPPSLQSVDRSRSSQHKSTTASDGRPTVFDNGRKLRNNSRGDSKSRLVDSLQDEPLKLQQQPLPEQLSLIPPPKPTVKTRSETSVMLRWLITSNDVLFVKVQYKRVGNGRTSTGWQTVDEDLPASTQSFEVTRLQPGGTYRFRLVAVYSNNDNKHGPNSARIQLQSIGRRAKAPTTGPFVVEVRPLPPRSISITWQYLPIERVTIDGFVVQYRRYERESDNYIEQRIHNISTRQTLIEDLDEDAIYSIRMLCYNSHGRSAFSNTVVKKTLGDTDSSASDPAAINKEHDSRKNLQSSSGVLDAYGPSTSKRPFMDSSPPRVAVRQENSMLYITLGVVCGAIIVGIIILLYICFRRLKQQRLLVAALQLRSKQPLPIKPTGKPNATSTVLRPCSDRMRSPVTSVSTLEGVPRMDDTWSRQYMHNPSVYDDAESRQLNVSGTLHPAGQQTPQQRLAFNLKMPGGNLSTRNTVYHSSKIGELNRAQSTSPTAIDYDSLPTQRTLTPDLYPCGQFRTFMTRTIDSESSHRQSSVDPVDADDVDNSCNTRQTVLSEHCEVGINRLTASADENFCCGSSDDASKRSSLQGARVTSVKMDCPESTV